MPDTSALHAEAIRDLTPADLVTRARDCLTSGDEQGAIAAALVALAEVMVARHDEPGPIPEGATRLDPDEVAMAIRQGWAR